MSLAVPQYLKFVSTNSCDGLRIDLLLSLRLEALIDCGLFEPSVRVAMMAVDSTYRRPFLDIGLRNGRCRSNRQNRERSKSV